MNSTPIKATVAQVPFGNIEIEGLMDDKGCYYVAVPQLTDIELIPPNRSVKQLEALLGMDLEITKASVANFSKPINAISIKVLATLVNHLAAQGNIAAYNILLSMGETPIMTNSLKKALRGCSSLKNLEKEKQEILAAKLNGVCEVITLAGRIDILTSTELIEVKSIKDWKSALGQVLVYGYYYPSHSLRIHLFGETQESYLNMIKDHCNRFNISVTWER